MLVVPPERLVMTALVDTRTPLTAEVVGELVGLTVFSTVVSVGTKALGFVVPTTVEGAAGVVGAAVVAFVVVGTTVVGTEAVGTGTDSLVAEVCRFAISDWTTPEGSECGDFCALGSTRTAYSTVPRSARVMVKTMRRFGMRNTAGT
jgi:hypothetical protein